MNQQKRIQMKNPKKQDLKDSLNKDVTVEDFAVLPEHKDTISVDNFDSNEIDSLKTEYKEEKQEVEKKKRGRKPKSQDNISNQKTAQQVENENMFSHTACLSAHIALDLIFSRIPGAEKLNDVEKQSFDASFTAVAKKYYSTVERFSEELNLTIALFVILTPRIQQFQKNKNESKGTNNTSVRENGHGEINPFEATNQN